MAKMDFGQVLLIVTAVQQFVSKVKATVKGTHAQKKAAILAALNEALAIVETLTGKELADNAKFKAGLASLVEAFLKAPSV